MAKDVVVCQVCRKLSRTFTIVWQGAYLRGKNQLLLKYILHTQEEQAHSEDHRNKGKVFSATSVTRFGQLSPNHDYRGLCQSPAGRFKEMNNNIKTQPVPALGQTVR